MKNLMKAAVLHQFVSVENFRIEQVPRPEIASNEVLIKLDYSAVSPWDIFEREGGYAEMLGKQPNFPYILGSEGAGTIAAVGEEASHFSIGEAVYATCFLNPKGGTYAEYAAVNIQFVSRIPKTISAQEAAVISGIGITALRGLDDVLQLQPNETILIFGASGGVGHLAVQLAKAMGSEVIAVASGEDGVALVKQMGIEKVIDGRNEEALEQIKSFAPIGVDAALLTASGTLAAEIIKKHVRKGGRAAYPNGVYFDGQVPEEVELKSYNAEPDAIIIAELNKYIENYSVTAHIEESFPLHEIKEAHRQLEKHYSGKLLLRIDE